MTTKKKLDQGKVLQAIFEGTDPFRDDVDKALQAAGLAGESSGCLHCLYQIASDLAKQWATYDGRTTATNPELTLTLALVTASMDLHSKEDYSRGYLDACNDWHAGKKFYAEAIFRGEGHKGTDEADADAEVKV